MSGKYIGIALGSTYCRIGDLHYNLAQIADFADQAREARSHALLTPELSVTGYGPYPEVVALAEKAGEGPAYEGLAAIAKKSGVILVAGFVERHDHGPGISHYVVFPGGEFLVQRKVRVTPFESPLVSINPAFPPGRDVPEKLDFGLLNFPTFEIQGLKCAVVICADFGIERLHDYFDTLGVRVVFMASGAGGNVNERVRVCDLLTPEGLEKYRGVFEKAFFPKPADFMTSVTHRRAVVGLNQTGWDGRKCSHIGDGGIITPRGEMAAFLYGMHNLDFQRPAFSAGRIPVEHFEPFHGGLA